MQRQKRILWTAVLLISSLFFRAQAQQPYQLNTKNEAFIAGGSALIGGLALIYRNALEPLSIAEVNNLQPTQINGFDRQTIHWYSPTAARNSDIALYTTASLTAASILGTALSSEKAHDNLILNTVLFVEANLLNTGLTELTKNTIQRVRPFVYNANVASSSKLTKDAKRSFFSGHTSVVATNSFFSAHLVTHYFNIDKKWLVWIPAAALPAYTAFERVRAGKHFISDVAAGYAVGAACGLLIPHFHKANTSIEINTTAIGNATGIELVYIF